jgi:hypothetical protein
MAPLRREPASEDMLPEDAGLTATQLRRKVVGEVQKALADLGALATAQMSTNGQELCRKLGDFAEKKDALTERVHRAFDDAEIFVLTRGQVVSWPLDSVAKATKEECAKFKARADVKRLAAVVQTASEKFTRAFDEIFRFEPDSYDPRLGAGLQGRRPDRLPHGQQNGWRSATSRPSRSRIRRPTSTASDRPTSSSASSAMT